MHICVTIHTYNSIAKDKGINTIDILLYHYIIVLLDYITFHIIILLFVVLFYYIIILLYYYLLYYYIIILLYYYIIILSYYHISILLYYYIIIMAGKGGTPERRITRGYEPLGDVRARSNKRRRYKIDTGTSLTSRGQEGYVYMYVCVWMYVFIKLHITTQSGPVILIILCHSH